ncbi:MAG: LysM peptidoglycan-binding domain-containing protein [Nitrospira sp.]
MGDLAKLTIKPEKGAEIRVMFNPNSYSISKSVTWSAAGASGSGSETRREVNAPPLQFGGGGSRQLSMELFFDVTEQSGADVREKTDQIARLTLINRELKTRPPWCVISWGATKGDFPFKGVVTSLTQKFTLFSSSGTPIRATLNVTFTEYLDPEEDKRQTDPDYTTWLVKHGDNLSNVASQVYGNPSLWRAIAEYNDIDDPFSLETGQRLRIPDVRA